MPGPAHSLPPQPKTVEMPFENDKRTQAAITRYRLYPLTIFYSLFAVLMVMIGVSSKHPWTTVAFFSAGCVIWTFIEYLFHRYVQHGRFPPAQGIVRRFLDERLDPFHPDHHLRPFDGRHISELKDVLPLFFLAGPISAFFPVYTTPVLLAGVLQSYVVEEWLHYALHFSNCRLPFFGRLNKHLYYRCQRGIYKGHGNYHSILGWRVRDPDLCRHGARQRLAARLSCRVNRLAKALDL